MGYYIETPESHNKAQQLVRLHQAELVLAPEKFNFGGTNALICVVENGFFDAAGIAFNERERDIFLLTANDRRPRTWLQLPKNKVMELCPQVKREFVMKNVTITITPELFDATVADLSREYRPQNYTCRCLVANGINAAFPDRKVEGLGTSYGWFAGSTTNLDFELDSKGEAVIRTFDTSSTRMSLRQELPLTFNLTLRNE